MTGNHKSFRSPSALQNQPLTHRPGYELTFESCSVVKPGIESNRCLCWAHRPGKTREICTFRQRGPSICISTQGGASICISTQGGASQTISSLFIKKRRVTSGCFPHHYHTINCKCKLYRQWSQNYRRCKNLMQYSHCVYTENP